MSNEIPPKLQVLARNQAFMVSRKQALSFGLTGPMVDAKLKSGWWQQVHVGVYATFTGPVSRPALLWAAVLSAGQGAYLSHETAAEINQLTDDPSPLINVTIPSHRRIKPPKGVVIHLASHEAMIWTPPGLPPDSIAEQTVIDLVHSANDKDDVIAVITSGFNKKLLEENHLKAVAATVAEH